MHLLELYAVVVTVGIAWYIRLCDSVPLEQEHTSTLIDLASMILPTP